MMKVSIGDPSLDGRDKGRVTPLPNPLPQAVKSLTARRGERELATLYSFSKKCPNVGTALVAIRIYLLLHIIHFSFRTGTSPVPT